MKTKTPFSLDRCYFKCHTGVNKKTVIKKLLKIGGIFLVVFLFFVTQNLQVFAKGLPDHLATLTPADRRNGIISPSASVTIVTFEDYECEACSHTHKILKSLRSRYAGRINFIYRHYPLVDQHPQAMKAALVVEAAAEQGNFMQKHDELLENPSLLANLTETASSSNLLEKIKQDETDAKKLGVEGTPTTFVNGRNVGYITDLETITKEIEKDILPIFIKFSPKSTGAKTGSLTITSGANTAVSSFTTDVTSKLPIKIIYESEGKTSEQTIPNDPSTVCQDTSDCSISVPIDFTVTNTGDVTSGTINLPGDPSIWKITAYDPGGQEIAIYNGGVGSSDTLWFKDLEEKFRKQEENNPFSPNPLYIFAIISLLIILAWWKFRRR